MSKELSKIIKNLPDYVQFYISQNKDFQQDILQNKLTDEEIIWEVDFQVEQMKTVKKPITIRLSEYDIFKFKHKAYQSRIPYQTLINQRIHKEVYSD